MKEVELLNKPPSNTGPTSDASVAGIRPKRLQKLKEKLQEPETIEKIATIGGVVASVAVSILADAILHKSDQREYSVPAEGNATSDAVSGDSSDAGVRRNSPVNHVVSGYERTQRVGPQHSETKTVYISSYPRGGN